MPLIASYRTPATRARLPELGRSVDAAAPAAETAEWTRAAVARGAAECDALFVVGHHPLYSPGEHANSADLIAAYGAALEAAGADAYLAGHDHILAHSRTPAGGVEHVLTGAGSEVRPELVRDAGTTRFVATARGFTVHSVNATHAAHSYVWSGAAGAGGAPGRLVFQVVRPLRAKAGRGG